jgi:hypothetical protein
MGFSHFSVTYILKGDFIHGGTGIIASPRNNYTLVDHSIVSKWHGT